MVANQTECCRLEQSSVIKFLAAEKCKLSVMFTEGCEMCMEKHVKVENKLAKHGSVSFLSFFHLFSFFPVSKG